MMALWTMLALALWGSAQAQSVLTSTATNDSRLVKVPEAKASLDQRFNDDKPITVRADEVIYQSKKKLNTWRGHVVLKHGSTVLRSQRMLGSQDRESARAEGQVSLIDPQERMRLTCETLEYKNRMKHILASGQPLFVLTDEKGQETQIQSETMEIENQTKTATAHGNVRIKEKDISATSNEAVYYDSEQRVDLSGDPRVVKGRNQFNGQKISAFLKQNKIVIMGDVKATLYPHELSGRDNKPAMDPAPATTEHL